MQQTKTAIDITIKAQLKNIKAIDFKAILTFELAYLKVTKLKNKDL